MDAIAFQLEYVRCVVASSTPHQRYSNGCADVIMQLTALCEPTAEVKIIDLQLCSWLDARDLSIITHQASVLLVLTHCRVLPDTSLSHLVTTSVGRIQTQCVLPPLGFHVKCGTASARSPFAAHSGTVLNCIRDTRRVTDTSSSCYLAGTDVPSSSSSCRRAAVDMMRSTVSRRVTAASLH